MLGARKPGLPAALHPWGFRALGDTCRIRVRKSDFPESQNVGERNLKTIDRDNGNIS